MAGTVVTTESTIGTHQRVKFAWTSSSGGAADATTTAKFSGVVHRAVFVPGTSGNQPTDAYDVTVTDADGVDVLNSLGANLSNAANVQKTANDGLGIVHSSALTLAVTNAGDTKTGSVILHIVHLDEHW